MAAAAPARVGWRSTGKIALALVLTLAALVGLPFLFADASTMDLLEVSLAGLVAGASCLYLAWRRFRRREFVRDTPTSTVRSIAVGTVEITGEATPAGDPARGPLSDREACIAELAVQEVRTDGDGHPSWETVLTVREDVAFHVDDGTGRVLVDPTEADLATEVEQETEVTSSQAPPERLERWAKRADLDARPGEQDPEEVLVEHAVDVATGHVPHVGDTELLDPDAPDRRYKERILPAGEQAYVLGAAQPREDVEASENARNLVVEHDDTLDEFLVSDKTEDEIVTENLLKTVVFLCVAVVGIPYGLLGLLHAAGGV
jgi:hypothetical protein